MSGFWNADSDRDWDSWVHEFDKPTDTVPREHKEPEHPIKPSQCPVCKSPTRRPNELCAKCRVAA